MVLFPRLVPKLMGRPKVKFVLIGSVVGNKVIVNRGKVCCLRASRIANRGPLSGCDGGTPGRLGERGSFGGVPSVVIGDFCSGRARRMYTFRRLVKDRNKLNKSRAGPFVLCPSR